VSDERPRPSAADIYDRVKRDATDELSRPVAALAFSGLFAGATVGFGGLAAAAAAATVGPARGAALLAAVFYPVGFIATIIGRAQLFTENTLYPLTLVLDERRHVRVTIRLWTVVLAANLVGAVGFAALVVESGAVPHDVVIHVVNTGRRLSAGSWSSRLWSGLIAGWLLALVAWTIEASDHTVGQIALIWAITFVIAAVGLCHCVSTTSEVLAAVFHGSVSFSHLLAWLSAVILGNIIGGVLIVAVLNYGQVRAGE
jgi:formate/nitrite transporter FocA (FNT family)